jgi:hypothetical protein
MLSVVRSYYQEVWYCIQHVADPLTICTILVSLNGYVHHLLG